MKKSRFTEQQIVYAIKQVEAGVPITELCRKYGISQQTFYRWRRKYGGLAPTVPVNADETVVTRN